MADTYGSRRFEDTNDPVATYSAFTGLRNTVAAERLKETDLVSALNVDLDNAGTLLRRSGTTRRLVVDAHSLFSNGELSLFVSGTSLYRFNPDFTSTLVATGLSQGLRMRYAEVNDIIFQSNGAETGAYQNNAVRSWGVLAPTQQPTASATFGILPAGTYQYAVTFERNDGQESGTGLASSITLAEDSGIRFTNIPVSANPSVESVRIYLSTQNGDMLFYALSVPNGTQTIDFVNGVVQLGSPLRTQFMNKPKPMQEIAAWNGRIYGLQFDELRYTELFGYELYREANYLKLNGAGKMLAPVTDGLFVATDKETVFFKGTGPEDFRPVKLAGYGAIFGTMAYIEHDELGVVPMWESTQGKVIGTDSGQLKNVTRANFTYASAPIGAGVFVQSGGINKYISVLQG